MESPLKTERLEKTTSASVRKSVRITLPTRFKGPVAARFIGESPRPFGKGEIEKARLRLDTLGSKMAKVRGGGSLDCEVLSPRAASTDQQEPDLTPEKTRE